MQGDFSILDRKSEENGVAEAASQFNENVGFMAYNALAGGMLTGKYMDVPSAFDDPNRARGKASLENPRGRMDTRGWGGTLIRYRTEAAQEAIQQYDKIAKANKMSLTELSLRWCKERDLITTTLLGHTSTKQLKETLVSVSDFVRILFCFIFMPKLKIVLVFYRISIVRKKAYPPMSCGRSIGFI